MENLTLFYIALAVWGIGWGVSVFIAERVIVVVAAIAAIVTGVLALILGLD